MRSKGVYEDESQVGEVTKTIQIVPENFDSNERRAEERFMTEQTSAEVLSVTFAGMADGDTVRKTDYTAGACCGCKGRSWKTADASR